MQLALRPYVTAAGVVVVCAGLIHVTPVAATHIEQRAVELASVGDTIDLVGPIDAGFSPLTETGGSALASVTDALTSGGAALSAEASDALPSAADLELFDPAFWQSFWDALINPEGESAWLMLTGAVEQLPVIGPLLQAFGLFVVFPVSLLVAYAWSEISQLLGIDPYGAAAEGLEGIDPATPIQDVSTALDPGVLTSALDLNPIADIGTLVDASTIPDLSEMLTSLIP